MRKSLSDGLYYGFELEVAQGALGGAGSLTARHWNLGMQ